MRILLAGLAAAVLVGLAPATWAQDEPPSPEAVAANKATADQILADGGGAAFFSNETAHDNRMDVRHTASGVYCQFQKTGVNVLTLADPTGDAFTCDTRDTSLNVSWTLTVRRTSLSFKEERKAADALLKAKFPKARTIVEPGVGRMLMSKDQRQWAEAGYNRYYSVDDGVVRRRSVVTMKNGWLLILDANAPQEKFDALELISNVLWMDAVMGASEKATRETAAKAGQATP